MKSPKTSFSTDRATAYAKSVLAGEIVAGPHVRNACRRHLDDLKRTDIAFDPADAAKGLRFFETKLKLSEGQFENRPFKSQPAQDFIIGSIFGWKRLDGTRRFRRAYIEQGKGNGKALALDTPIPTPCGWTTMGSLQDGDEVFDEQGQVCRVLQAHPVSEDRTCYEVEFDDGERIVASAEHLWVTEHRRPKPGGKSIKTTAEIAASLRNSNGKYQSANHSVALAVAFDLPEQDFLIPPYVLGAWLGDGDSDCARMTCAFADVQVMDEMAGEGVPVKAQVRHSETTGRFVLSSGRGRRGSTVQERLRALGVLGNKHIPPAYLRGSKAQRLALLQGLMDTDGSVSKVGQCEFTATNKVLALGALELAISLGIKATMIEGVATLNGRAISAKYRVGFFPDWDVPVFRLERKAARQVHSHDRRRLCGDRRIVSCRQVPAVPVRCITVDSPSSMFLCGRNMVPTHNSPLAGGIGLYGLMADDEAGAEIYSAGATKEQAGILFRDAVKMVDKSPDLDARLKRSGGPGREYNLAYLARASFFRPVSRETKKTGSGPRPHFALVDELHEHPDGGVIEILERGFKFRRQPLLLMITNSGSNRNSVCWVEHEHAIRIAAGNTDAKDEDAHYLGNVLDDTTFSYVCALDPDDKPLDDPACWIKANPLLGVTITEEYLRGVVAQAKAMPSKLNGILRLHFCQWTEAETAWMTRAALEPALADFDPALLHHGKEIWLGCDLSQNRDITALGAVVKTGEVEVEAERDGVIQKVMKPTFDAWIEAWTPGDTIAARSLQDKTPYQQWAEAGHIHAPKGQSIRFDHVAQALAEYTHDYDVKCLAYDRYAFRRGFEPECEKLGLNVEFVEHPQGGTKKGKPTDAMTEAAEEAGKEAEGLWMPASVRELEDAILEGRIRIQRNPVLVSAMMSAMTDEDRWGNRWLAKERAVNKIDCAVALAMAVGAACSYEGHSGTSAYEAHGLLFV